MSDSPAAAPAQRRFTMPSPRTAMAAALAVAVSIAAGLWLAPWVLPLRIIEGPYLQNTTETATTVMWWTLRPSQCELVLTVAGAERVLQSPENGLRNRVRIEDLTPGTSYAYRIRNGSRTLGEGTLRTNHRGERPVRFVVFGDSGKGTREQYALAAKMVEQHPDFVLHTGDLVYGGGEREHYPNRFFGPYRGLLSDVNFWPCLGNHDVGGDEGAAPYREIFELPANGPEGATADDNYWFDYANVRIAVLDSNPPEAELRSRVAPWIERVFADAGDRWRIVAFHHPPYSLGKYGCDRRIHNALLPQLEASGVDAVFCGHDHMYSRTVSLRQNSPAQPAEDGIVYVVTGAGGAELYKARKSELDAAKRGPGDELALYPSVHDETHSFSLVEISGDTLRLRQLTVTGDTLDDWSIARIPAAPQ